MQTVGLIGYGYWGPNLLRNYMELKSANVKWVCDLNPDNLAKVTARFPSVQTTSSLDEMLADPELDAVLIATPISTHFPLTMKALNAGKHVFVEKPMATSVAECEEMTETAKRLNLTLMVGHTFVYSPPVRKVKEIIESGELGEIYFITTSRVNLGLHQKDASVVWDLAPHDLSILEYWLDGPPDTLSVLSRGCISENPDVAFLNLRYSSGIVAEVSVAWLAPMKLRRTIVVGSRKMLVYDDSQSSEKVKIYDQGVDYRDPQDYEEFKLSYRTGDIVSPKIDPTEPLQIEAQHFIESIESGAEPITGGRAGVSVVASLEAAQRSVDNGGCSEDVRAGASR